MAKILFNTAQCVECTAYCPMDLLTTNSNGDWVCIDSKRCAKTRVWIKSCLRRQARKPPQHRKLKLKL